MGSALPDPVKDQAALAPIPAPAIENKPAPGQTGPKGMAPRTTYSRVNTGSPPVLDGGAMGQKNSPNRGMEFLPAKIAAQRGSMTTMHSRPSLQDMVKQAMAGTASALSVNLEAARQRETQGSTKTASVKVAANHVPTELVSKLAGALSFIEQELLKEADGPGEGPGALTVMESVASGPSMDAGESGQATAKNQPPMNPPLQPDKAQEGNAGTGLQTNDDMSHPAQPVEPIKNASAKILERLNKNASVMGKAMGARDAVKGALGAAKGFGAKAVSTGKSVADKTVATVKAHPRAAGAAAAGAVAGGAAGVTMALKGKKKEGSAPIALLRKLAEDAINPANIESSASVNPAEPPPGASASGEGVPSEPSDVSGQKSMIASNEAAINYTKGQAKADPKRDVNQVLTEPALSSASDKVLQEAFIHTGDAGVKISSTGTSLRKTASQIGAQRAILAQLLKQATADCVAEVKDKKSMGMAPSTPQAATGASAATMGQ